VLVPFDPGDAFYDVDVRTAIERASLQRLLVENRNLQLWGPLEAAPDISDNVKQPGCFFTNTNDTDKKRQQKEFPIWCRQHKRVEKLILLYVVIHAIALGRGQGYDKDQWDEMLFRQGALASLS
jgi:hypothetical protein